VRLGQQRVQVDPRLAYAVAASGLTAVAHNEEDVRRVLRAAEHAGKRFPGAPVARQPHLSPQGSERSAVRGGVERLDWLPDSRTEG
jgi:hypothetical protein